MLQNKENLDGNQLLTYRIFLLKYSIIFTLLMPLEHSSIDVLAQYDSKPKVQQLARQVLQIATQSRARVSLGEETINMRQAPDTLDVATVAQVDAVTGPILEMLAGKERELSAAIDRIREGTYGQCTACLKSIPFQRLEANPVAERCMPCQVQFERGK